MRGKFESVESFASGNYSDRKFVKFCERESFVSGKFVSEKFCAGESLKDCEVVRVLNIVSGKFREWEVCKVS